VTSTTLTHRTVHGLKWSYGSAVIDAAITVAVAAVLARLLHPAAFGLLAMGLVVLRFGQYFATMGVGSALVQKPELTDDDVRAGFTSSVLLGLVVFALFVICAPLVNILFRGPQVVTVVRVMALSFAISGTSITSLAILRRRLAFKQIALIENSTYAIAYGGVSITLAFLGAGVWSMVAGSLLQYAAASVLYYVVTRHKITPILRWQPYRRLYSFGARVSVISLLEYVTFNMDTLWIGHFSSEATLGIYNRAFNLASLPTGYLATSFSRVLFPSFSRIQKQTARLRGVYLPAIFVFSIIAMPLCWGMAAAAPQIVRVLLGNQWSGSVRPMSILALAMPFTLLSNFAGVLCEATAHLNVKMLIRASQIVFVLALFAFLTRFGPTGIATGYAIGQLATTLAYLLVLRSLLDTTLFDLLKTHRSGVVAGLVTAALIWGTSALGSIGGLPAVVVLLIEMVVGLAAVILWLLRASRGSAWWEIRRRLIESQIGVEGTHSSRIMAWMDSHARTPAAAAITGTGPT
jgi:O-antigen/teichoic acid export membrane protein